MTQPKPAPAQTKRKAQQRQVQQGDTAYGPGDQQTEQQVVSERIEAKQLAKLSALSDILHAKPDVELDDLAQTLLGSFSSDEQKALERALKRQRLHAKDQTPIRDLDHELSSNLATGAYPYKYLMSRQTTVLEHLF